MWDALGRRASGGQCASPGAGEGCADSRRRKKDALTVFAKRRTLGSRTTLDVLNSEQELLTARASKLEAEANRYIGVYQILAAMGQLSAEKLNLGIPSYDVEAYFNSVKNAPPIWANTSKQGAALDRILSKDGELRRGVVA
ncbi:MAG: hypothetical protein U5N55_09410 [Cypionkella sp.]|nr:hypothetical protein [Cypionkella sp.]